MADFFKDYRVELHSPARDSFSVTPDDSADLPHVARALYIGVSGDVRMTTIGGTDITYKSVPVGFFEHGATRIWVTGTTATDINAVRV